MIEVETPDAAGVTDTVALLADVSSTVQFSSGGNATNLVLALAANSTYLIRCRFTLTNARIALLGPAGMTGVGRISAKPDPTNTGVRTTTDLTFASPLPSAAVGHATLDTEGELWARVVTTNAGNLTLQIASNTGAITHTRLRAGSTMEARLVDGATLVSTLAADASTSSATGVDTALALPVAANSIYLLRLYGRATANGASIRFAFTGPAGMTISGFHTGFGSSAVSEANRQEVTTPGAITTNTSSNGISIGAIHTWLRVKTGANAGTLTVQTASSTGGTTVTLHAGSTLTLDAQVAEV